VKKLFKNDYERGKLLVDISVLLKEGYNISEAIELYAAFLMEDKREWLLHVYNEMEKGDTFADQLFEAGFTKEIINFIRMLETYGSFQKALSQSGYLLLKRHELKKQMQSVLHYPLALSVGVVILGMVLMEGILPQFQQFFEAMDHELPAVTKSMLFFIDWFRLPLFLSVLICGIMIVLWIRRKPAAEQVDFMMKIPLVHKYVRQLISYYFTAQLAPMLQGGLSLQQALYTMKEESMLAFFRMEAGNFIEKLEAGDSFTEVLHSSPYFISQIAAVWSFGESRGAAAQELDSFSAYLFQQMYDHTNKAIRLVQPLVFCLIGAIVIVLFVSMMMPVFSIIDSFA